MFFHNRLTHSLKVAQLSRRIAEKLQQNKRLVASLGGINEDVAEAAGLAHDLGHPPFGHAAEMELDRLARTAGCEDGFEGNTQSFRIVTRLATSDAILADAEDDDENPDDAIEGLNLTRATLNAVLKYPWAFNSNPANRGKWGVYSEDHDVFAWVRKALPGQAFIRSVEAEIMDWADDITFAVHDLFDFFRAGLIPLDRIVGDLPRKSAEAQAFLEFAFERSNNLRQRRTQVETGFEEILAADLLTIGGPYEDSFSDRSFIWRATTTLITKFVDAISLRKPTVSDPTLVGIDPLRRCQVNILKQLAWRYVILRPELNSEQAGQVRMVRTLFWHLLRASRKETDWRYFPTAFREDLLQRGGEPTARVRVVVDCIASMTEAELKRQFRLVTGSR